MPFDVKDKNDGVLAAETRAFLGHLHDFYEILEHDDPNRDSLFRLVAHYEDVFVTWRDRDGQEE